MAIEKLGAFALATLSLAPTQDVSRPRATCTEIREIRDVSESMYAEACRKTSIKNGEPVVILVQNKQCTALAKLAEQSRRAEKKYCTKPIEAKN